MRAAKPKARRLLLHLHLHSPYLNLTSRKKKSTQNTRNNIFLWNRKLKIEQISPLALCVNVFFKRMTLKNKIKFKFLYLFVINICFIFWIWTKFCVLLFTVNKKKYTYILTLDYFVINLEIFFLFFFSIVIHRFIYSRGLLFKVYDKLNAEL